jgi:hypothetical protein
MRWAPALARLLESRTSESPAARSPAQRGLGQNRRRGLGEGGKRGEGRGRGSRGESLVAGMGEGHLDCDHVPHGRMNQRGDPPSPPP